MRGLGWLWICLSGLYGAMSVSLGAYAAHGMSGQTAHVLELMEKATRYQLTHALVLLIVGGASCLVSMRGGRTLWLDLAGALFAIGVFLFCGTLYAIALADIQIAPVAPYGGTAMILGWLVLMIGGVKMRSVLLTYKLKKLPEE